MPSVIMLNVVLLRVVVPSLDWVPLHMILEDILNYLFVLKIFVKTFVNICPGHLGRTDQIIKVVST